MQKSEKIKWNGRIEMVRAEIENAQSSKGKNGESGGDIVVVEPKRIQSGIREDRKLDVGKGVVREITRNNCIKAVVHEDDAARQPIVRNVKAGKRLETRNRGSKIRK